jgi:rod shape-determining protein MreC
VIEVSKHIRNKRLFVLMLGLILFIAVIGFSIADRKNLSWPENFIKDTVGFVQQWFYKPAGYMAGLFEDIRTLRTLREENEQLRQLAAAYARDKAEYNFVRNENERLKKELGFTERQQSLYKYKYMIAQVVAVSPDPYNRTIRINLGSKDGVRTNMAVTSVEGLVGIVSKVSPFHAEVMPLTELDDSSLTSKSIAATIRGREDKSFGIVSSYDDETGMLHMNKIPENDEMTVGDTVITSGFGNVYPRGLTIGTVETVQVGDMGLTKVASVRPAVDFDHLSEVFVVEVPGQEETSE